MSDWTTCPICGKRVELSDCAYLDNGSPACEQCASQEQARDEEDD